MDIGISLPTMAGDYTRETTVRWCAGIDDGPYSSISAGERITFRNQELTVVNAAAAALTERVRVFVNLVVLPMHPVALVAKQVATLDVLSGGRVDLGVGVGGRGHDYRALDADESARHQRLDDGVAQLRQLWAGEAPFDRADPIGPNCVQPGGPPILAGAMGPKALARAAQWADGISGFSIEASPDEMAASVTAARAAWRDAGRTDAPRVVSGCFYALGVPDAQATLGRFTYDYLAIFGDDFARAVAQAAPVWNEQRLAEVVAGAAAAGVDELILVPATTDIACLDATTALLA